MNIKLKLQAILLVVVLLTVNGCDSDPVAPHDDPPTLSVEDTAYQTGMVALAALVVGPALLNGEVTKKGPAEIIEFDNEDGIVGTAHLEYFLGGPKGDPSTSEAADYAHLYTGEGMPLMVELGLGGGASFSFDLEGDIDQENKAAVINGSGYFQSGPHMSHFEINDMPVDNVSDYPNAGTIVFLGLLYEITAYCDGTYLAVLEVTNGPAFWLDLDTGDVWPKVDDN